MRKLFLKSVTLLFLLVMSVNAAWAGGSAFNAVLQQLKEEVYFAEMTGKPSVTGSGKVYVDKKGDCPSDWSDLTESNAATLGIGACVEGMEMIQVPFKLYCKANDGWYFKGWSYTEGGSDLDSIKREDGDTKDFDSQIFVKVNPSNAKGEGNAAKYTMFATFEKIYISSYSVSGNTTVDKGESVTQTVTFTLTGKNIDIADFETPTIENEKENAGTWACVGGVNVNGTAKTATVSVRYTALNKDGVESSATLRLATKSNSVMEVPLAARTSVSEDVEAMLYDGDIRQKETITTVSELLNVNISGYKKPILKLNRDYGELTISKNLTLDLNGYNLASLTSTGDKVTLAYSVYGGNITGAVKVNAGQLTMAGGTIDGEVTIKTGATLIQNGATINAETTNHGTMKTTDGVHTATVKSDGTLSINGGTFTPVSGVAIDITGGTADIKKGTIEGETYGVQSAATTTIEKLAEISGKTKALKINSGTTTINCGKFVKPENLADGTIVFKSAYFKEKTGVVDEKVQGKQLWRNTSGAEFRDGYNFFAGEYAAAKSANVSVCRIGNISFSSLEDALAYANTNADKEVVIVMINDYVMPAGYYTLPAKALLLIPMSEKQDAGFKIPNRNSSADVSYIPPTKYLKLTLADGVNLDVYGTIEVSGSQLSTNDSYTGAPYGPYGQLQMNKGSRMTLQNESELRAWGFVTGDVEHKNTATHEVPMGEIDARRGSLVRELFQMGDWKDFAFSGRGLLANAGSLGEEIFPITQYYIQNVEVPVKYHPGAHLSTATSVYANIPDAMIKQIAGDNPLEGDMQVVMTANHIQIVGADTDDAMFLMNEKADAENTWVRKWYDASKDQQVYEINSGAHIGKLVIPLVYVGGDDAMLNMNSAAYNLPITCNFKLHLLNGDMDFTQSTELLPGSEVEVDKEARVYVSEPENKVRGGYLYLYDWQDWDIFAGRLEEPNVYARKIKYTPSFNDGVNNGAVPDEVRDVSSPEKIGSASVNVHGTFDTQGGYVYTTEHGANIFSSIEDAGTFLFSNAAASEPVTIQQVKNINEMGNGTKVATTCYPAWLRNSDKWVESNGGDEEFRYVKTEGTQQDRSYCYLDIDGQGGRWTLLEQRGCFTYDEGNHIYYIKPQEYVAVAVTSATRNGDDWVIKGNDDHTFSDAAGTGRLFILLTDNQGNNCQWWEVEKKDNLYHCIHPDNDTYYYWDEEREIDDVLVPGWAEKKFTITWKDWNGQIIKDANDNDIVYTVPYGAQAEWLSSKPTRESTQDYTYDFTGWSPALAKVTSDVTYTATYEEKPIKYAVYFKNDNGVEIEHHMLARNEFPVCENTPTRTGYTLQWSPEVQAVTGEATYTATWTLIPPDEYEITFYDYDGTTELQKGNVAVGSTPKYTGSTPSGKLENREYTYVFDHWSPAIEEVSATSAKSYVAVYKEKPQTYTITFKNGSTTIESKKYAYGETPVCSTPPTQDNTAEWTYKLAWTPQIQAVTEPATYTADFETYKTKNKYTVSVKCTPSGAAVLTGGGIYEYGSSITISKTDNPGYTFQNWTDANGAVVNTLPTTVTGDINLVANFTVADPDYTITWKSEDGKTTLQTVGQKAGTATTYTAATPTKAATAQNTFTFDGWTTAANGAGTYYKNGMTPRANANASYFAHFAATPIPNLDVNSVSGPTVLSEPVTYHDLVITSNGVTSAQLIGENYLTLTGDAYFDLAINAQDHKWYAIAVPWHVDAEKGISVNGRTLTFGREFDILYYDGATRASEGTTGNAWTYMEDTHLAGARILQPGVLYMIGLTHEAPVIRFKAKDKLNLLNTTTSVAVHSSPNAVDANWNGIANPALFNAYVNAGVTLGQVYNASTNSYSTINLDSKKLVLGQPVFVQAPVAKSITVTYGGAYAAPRRAKAQTENTEYDVRIAPANAAYTDRLFVAVDDKENDTYTIGQDLAKMGVSTIVAQMWVNRYNTKLCQNTVAPVNGTAEFPLTISAPQEGRYVISIDQSALTAQNDLYLTYDGEVIWNLTNSAYTTTLQQGTDTHYGLRIKMENAPEVATDITEAIVDSKDTTANKVLINGHVFIIRGERAYTIDGQLVK